MHGAQSQLNGGRVHTWVCTHMHDCAQMCTCLCIYTCVCVCAHACACFHVPEWWLECVAGTGRGFAAPRLLLELPRCPRSSDVFGTGRAG